MKIRTINPIRFSFVMIFAGIFFLASGAAMAQSEQPAQKKMDTDAYAVESNNCIPARTFTYGGGASKFSFCISDHGNIQHLESPAKYQQINTREGYAVCRYESEGLNPKRSFDAGIAEGGFGPSIIEQPGGPSTLPMTITRQTTDGQLELKQTFDWNKAEKEILITMSLKNISAAPIPHVVIARYFDGDLDNTAGGDLYDYSTNSLWAREDDQYAARNGLTLTALTDSYKHYINIERAEVWDPYGTDVKSARYCHSGDLADGGQFPSDWIGRIRYILQTIQPGATKTVKYIYRRV